MDAWIVWIKMPTFAKKLMGYNKKLLQSLID